MDGMRPLNERREHIARLNEFSDIWKISFESAVSHPERC